MISGDHQSTCLSIAKDIGIPIENIISEVKPIQKAEKIIELQNGGVKRVMMVGDGINDSVALGNADVGVAIGSASDVSLDVADVVLMQDDLTILLTAFHLTKRIVTQININIIYATAFNVLAIPIAAGVLEPWNIIIPPAYAGLNELISSLPVIGMSLILIWYSPPSLPSIVDFEGVTVVESEYKPLIEKSNGKYQLV